MPSFPQMNERGFTLIEMSIVLIIIGLIIGGILKGQELIESARQKNFIAQIDAVRAGVNTFIDNYKSLPGDYNQASTNISSGLGTTGNGNNDGQIGTNATTLAQLIALDGRSGENMNFFNHLLAANLMGGASQVAGNTTVTNYAGNGTPSPLPASAYPSSGLMLAHGNHPGLSSNGEPRRALWLRANRFAAAPDTTTSVISPQRLFQLESKYDDQSPTSGRIRTDYQIPTGAAANACGGTAAAIYIATETAIACNIYITASD